MWRVEGNQRAVQRDDVAFRQQRFERRVGKAQQVGQKRVAAHVVGEHAHAEAASDADGVQADASRADDAQRLSLQVESGEHGAFQMAGADLVVGLVHLAREHQDQREGVLGDRVFAVRGHVGNGDPALAAFGEINVVEAGGARGDQARGRELVQSGCVEL